MPVKNDVLGYADVPVVEEEIALSDFQRRVLEVPPAWSVALTGGRGGGKSWTIAFLILRHIVAHGDRARVLFVRQTHQGTEDFVLILRELFMRIWGTSVTYNANTGIWRGFPGGGYVEINQIDSFAAYGKFQGRSFTMICADEIGQFPTDELINLLRSNLRGPADVEKRMVVASNPAGAGHAWVYRKFVLKAVAWVPYEIDGETWVTAPSTLDGNTFIDREKYLRDLQAACAHDKELARAFINGDWDVVRGGSFLSLDEKRVMFRGWTLPEGVTVREYARGIKAVTPAAHGVTLRAPDLEEWQFFLAMDWGFSAPCVVFLAARSPGATVEGRWYPRGSILLLDCCDTARPERLEMGMEMPVADVALKVKEMWRRWRLGGAPNGIADDAAGIRNQDGVSVVDSFADNGVYFREAGKGSRIGGWQKMREMLNDAGKVDRAGLYVSDLCTGFWATVPFLSRSLRNPEDTDGALDHWADAARYCVISKSNPRPVTDINL